MASGVAKQIVLFLVLVVQVILAYIEAAIKLFTPVRRKSIKDLNVLITGSGHGLGRELALKFASQGAHLCLVDINEQNNVKVREEIVNKYPKCRAVAISANISVESEVERLASKSEQFLGGPIDILINNAGVVQCLPFLDLQPKHIERTFQVNVLAHMWTIRHFLPSMLKRGEGHIVAISSIAGLIGGKYLTDYCSSKFAVVGLMDSLEREIHDNGKNENIHLTTVCPTCMSTGMFQTFTSRFAWLLPILDAKQVADCIVDAILTNKQFVAVPSITLIFHRLSYLLPSKVNCLVQNYLDYGVKPHKV